MDLTILCSGTLKSKKFENAKTAAHLNGMAKSSFVQITFCTTSRVLCKKINF